MGEGSSLDINTDQENNVCQVAFKKDCFGEKCKNKVKSKGIQKLKPDMPFPCTKCDKCFSIKSKFLKHFKTRSSNKSLKCSECSKRFKFIRNLKRHKFNMHINKPHICKECPKSFNSEERLKNHMQVHHVGYTCTECGYHASNRYNFNNHIINVHKPEERKFACCECDFKASEAYKLKYHMKRHKGEKPFICDVCGKQFVNLCNMQRHAWIHENKRPFACTTCNKTFRSKFNLQIHMHSHTKEKVFFCGSADCQFGSVTQGDLKIHMQTVHSNERPYECLACGKKYKTKGNLTKHQNGTRGTCHPTVPETLEILETLATFKTVAIDHSMSPETSVNILQEERSETNDISQQESSETNVNNLEMKALKEHLIIFYKKKDKE